MGTPNLVMPVSEAGAREIDLIPTWRYAGCYPPAVQLLQDLRQNPKACGLGKLVTHRFQGIDSVQEALRTACLSLDSENRMVVKVAVLNSS